MGSNRRSFFKATLATVLTLFAGRVNAKPRPSIQYVEYGYNAKTKTIPITFENSGGTATKEYRVSVETPEPRLVISYSDGTKAVFVGTEEVNSGFNVLEQAGWASGS